MSVWVWLVLTAMVGMPLASGAEAREPLGNLNPAEALAAFETEPGFVVELVAAEPLVVDPVAVAIDELGRMFVAEDRDYPVGSPDGRPLGIVAMLEDTDGDGRMDKRSEFATGIKFPNGVMCWRGGVIVTASPDVWWLSDTNGDGRADVKVRLLGGLDTSSTSQLRANDPTLGPDGWVYLAGGLRGGKVTSPRSPGVVVDTDKGDLRFKPDTGELEIVEGKSQFGLSFDDAGNRFACTNRIQSQHAPLPARYLARNPFVVAPGAFQNCPDIRENTLMTRYTAGAVRLFPISANLTTADSHVGTYTAACAVHIYRGASLPEAYRGAAFSCDPTANLVRADRLEKAGGTFAAVRIHDGTEALRSKDNWFRPVFLADGPDDAIYVADMYRKTIEHPDYLPGEVRKHTDFESGKDKGRVWRLRATGAVRSPVRKLAGMSPVDLVRALSSPAPWVRDTAFRLLVERERDAGSLVPLLKAAFADSVEAGPTVLLLRQLQLLGGLDEGVLGLALRHPKAAVRQNGVSLAEPYLDSSRALREAVEALAGDPDPHVRFQVALSLGGVVDPGVIPALARIAVAQAEDRWTRAAVLSALGDAKAAVAFSAKIGRVSPGTEGLALLAADLGRQIALSAGKEPAAGLASLRESIAGASGDIERAFVTGFAEGAPTAFQELVRNEPASAERWFGGARERATDLRALELFRLQAIRLLAFDSSPVTARVLEERLVTTEARDVQTASARALLRAGAPGVAASLLAAEAWERHSPALRQVLIGTMAGRAEYSGALLGAIESGTLAAGLLTPAQREMLRQSKDPAIKARAVKLLDAVGGDRRQAFEAAKAALGLAPVPSNGRLVFERACASCHRLNQLGVAVGPDLFDIRQQPKETILYHIIIPEAEIAPNFINYECELKDGRMLSGLLASESGASVTLRMAQGVEETVLRAGIAKLAASRLSLMPQELEKTMSMQELADLLAYLRGEQ